MDDATEAFMDGRAERYRCGLAGPDEAAFIAARRAPILSGHAFSERTFSDGGLDKNLG